MIVELLDVEIFMGSGSPTCVNVKSPKGEDKLWVQGQFDTFKIKDSEKYKKANISLCDLGHGRIGDRQCFSIIVIVSEIWQADNSRVFVINRFLLPGTVKTIYTTEIEYLAIGIPDTHLGKQEHPIVGEVYQLTLEFFE